MAQQKQFLEYAQERFDLPDYFTFQSLIGNDFALLNQKFLTNTTYIASGFAVQHVLPPSLNIRILVPNSVVFNSTQDGVMFVAPSAASNIDLTLLDGTTTYVWLTLGTVDNTPGLRTFWDPTAQNGQGAEFNQQVNTIRELTVTAHTSTIGFPVTPDVIHVCAVQTSGGTVTSLIDHRNLFFRLGKGGSSPNSNYVYPWSSGRSEPGSDLILDASAFTAGDKQLNDFKSWADAMMSQIKEIKFGTNSNLPWNELAPASLLSDYVTMTGGGVFTWTLGTNTLSFTSAITFLIPGTAFTNTISSGSIVLNANNKVAYIDINRTSNATLTPVVVDSSSFAPQIDRYIIVRRISNTAYIGID